MKQVVKRFSPEQPPDAPVYKNYIGHEKDFKQARLAIDGFSFFKDVVCHILPSLKNVK